MEPPFRPRALSFLALRAIDENGDGVIKGKKGEERSKRGTGWAFLNTPPYKEKKTRRKRSQSEREKGWTKKEAIFSPSSNYTDKNASSSSPKDRTCLLSFRPLPLLSLPVFLLARLLSLHIYVVRISLNVIPSVFFLPDKWRHLRAFKPSASIGNVLFLFDKVSLEKDIKWNWEILMKRNVEDSKSNDSKQIICCYSQ